MIKVHLSKKDKLMVMAKKSLILLGVFLISFFLLLSLWANEGLGSLIKRLEFLPPETELAEEDRGSEQGYEVLIRRYRSGSSQERIVNFYRTLFLGEGLREVRPYLEEGQPKPPELVYFFEKPGIMIILNFLGYLEEGRTAYYLSLYAVDPRVLDESTFRGF